MLVSPAPRCASSATTLRPTTSSSCSTRGADRGSRSARLEVGLICTLFAALRQDISPLFVALFLNMQIRSLQAHSSKRRRRPGDHPPNSVW